MVSNNGLITHCESNRLIFGTFEKFNPDTQEITQHVGSRFSEGFLGLSNVNNAQKTFDKALSDESIKRDTQAINDFNKMVNEQEMTVSEAVSHMTQASEEARNYCSTLEGGTADAEAFAAGQEEIYRNSQKNQKGFKKLSASTKAMIGNIGAMAAISLGITAVSWGWDKLNDHFKITPEKKLEAMETAVKKYNDRITETGENTKTLKSLQTEFSTLAKGVDDNGKNIGLSAEQYDRYNEIANQIASISPSLIQGYTAEGNAILNRNTAIQDGIKLQEEYANAARAAYTTNSTLNDIIDGSQINIGEARKEIFKYDDDLIKGLGGNIDTKVFKHKNGTKKKSTSKIIEDIIGESVDLEHLSIDQIEKIVDKSDLIMGKAREINQMSKAAREKVGYEKLSEEELSTLQDALTGLSDGYAEFETASEPVYENLLAYMSKINESTGKSLMETVPEEMQNAFQAGLRNIASQDLEASEMKKKAKTLAKQFADFSDTNVPAKSNLLGYKDAMEAVADAQADFDPANIEEYNDAVRLSVDSLEALADAQEKAGSDELANALRAQANEVESYAQDIKESLTDAFNPYQEAFKEAANVGSAFEEWRQGITDYSDGIESFGQMFESVLTKAETGGNGSMAFWKAAELSLGSKSLREFGYDVDSAKSKMKELKLAMSDGATATDYFYSELADNAGDINKLLGKTAVWEDSKGINFDIDTDEWAAVADVLGIAEDSMMALLNAAQQYSNIDLSNTDAVRQALSAQDTTKTKDGVMYALAEPIERAAAQSLGSVEAAHRRIQELNQEEDIQLIDISALKDNVNYTQEQLKTQTDAFKKYQQQARSSAETFSQLGFGQKNDKGFIFNVNDIADVSSAMMQMGGTAEDLFATLKAWRDDTTIDLGKQFEGMNDKQLKKFSQDAYAEYQEQMADVDPTTELTGATNKLTEAINQLIAAMGQIPDIEIEDNLDEVRDKIAKYNDAGDKEKPGLEKDIESGLKQTQKEMDTLKTSYDNMEEGAEKDALAKRIAENELRIQDYKALLKDIQDDGEINTSIKLDDSDAQARINKFAKALGMTPEEVQTMLKAFIEGDNVEEYIQMLDIAPEQKETVLSAITAYSEGDIQGYTELLSELPPEVQTLVSALTSGAVGNLQIVDGKLTAINNTTATPTVNVTDNASGVLGGIQGMLNGIKGGATAVVSVVKQVATKAAGKAGKAAEGTPNRRKQSHFPSMAKGGKVGPTGHGGLTLTGELGTELVWLPDESTSFLVGQYGPEMVNLPSNAVIYPADETRRIVGDTLTPGRLRFGSMATGSYKRGSSGSSWSSKNSSSSSSKKSSSSSKSSKSNEESQYEKNKKALDHELKMGYITQATYYSKLDALQKKYKNELAKDIDDQRAALEDLRDAWIDAFEEAKKSLSHQLEMGQISEAQYYDKLKALGDKYYKNRKGYTNEWKEHLEDLKDARKDAYDAQLEDLDKALEKETITVEKYYEKVKELQNKYLTGPEMKNDLKDATEDMYDALKDALDEMYDDVQQQIDDNDIFNLWVDGGDTAVDMLQAFRDQIAKDGRKYFESEKAWKEYLLELDRDIAEAEKDQAEERQDQLENILDLVEATLRQEAEDYIDALEDQIDAYQDLIDAKKKSLKLTEDELAYQEEMSDYAKDISKLQSEIELLSRDDSRAAAAKRAEKEEELAELLQEQQRTQREETLDRTEDSLDKQAELFEELINKQIELVNNWLDNKSAVLETVQQTIEQRETNNLLNRIIAYNGEHGDAMLSTVNKAWQDLDGLIGKYGDDIETIVEVLQKGIDVKVKGGIIDKGQTDYAETQQKILDKPVSVHHAGLATGFTGDGADLKQHEVYRLLTDDELVFNHDDQMRIAGQLQTLDTIKTTFAKLSKGIEAPTSPTPRNIELTVNAPITIKGNASAETVKEIKKAIDDASDKSIDRLAEALRINGVRGRVASNVRKN